MDGYEWNKIFGAGLGVVFVVFGLAILGDELYHPEENDPATVLDLPEAAITASADSGPAGPEPILALLASADVAAGENTAKKCVACHVFEKGGQNKVGPHLYGVVGRPIAEIADFGYSGAMKEYAALDGGKAWTYEEMNGFLWKPKVHIKGTAMGFAGLSKPEERANIIAWMNTLSDSPLPAPDEAAIAAEAGPAEGEAVTAEGAAPADGAAPVPAAADGAAVVVPADGAAAPATTAPATTAPATAAPAQAPAAQAPAAAPAGSTVVVVPTDGTPTPVGTAPAAPAQAAPAQAAPAQPVPVQPAPVQAAQPQPADAGAIRAAPTTTPAAQQGLPAAQTPGPVPAADANPRAQQAAPAPATGNRTPAGSAPTDQGVITPAANETTGTQVAPAGRNALGVGQPSGTAEQPGPAVVPSTAAPNTITPKVQNEGASIPLAPDAANPRAGAQSDSSGQQGLTPGTVVRQPDGQNRVVPPTEAYGNVPGSGQVGGPADPAGRDRAPVNQRGN